MRPIIDINIIVVIVFTFNKPNTENMVGGGRRRHRGWSVMLRWPAGCASAHKHINSLQVYASATRTG